MGEPLVDTRVLLPWISVYWVGLFQYYVVEKCFCVTSPLSDICLVFFHHCYCYYFEMVILSLFPAPSSSGPVQCHLRLHMPPELY